MDSKRRLWMIIGAGIVTTVVVVLIALRLTLVCCALPPTPPTLTAMTTMMTGSAGLEAVNQETVALLNQTNTAAYETAIAAVITATPSLYPYDPTLYAQRRHEEQILQTAGGPDDYATFYAEETSLVTTAESWFRNGNQYVDWVTQTALAAGYHVTSSPTSTPISYTADMSPTALPPPTRITRTATPTLCPPSDVICPGGNATMSAADKVMVLMASAKAPEFGQLAQTATALAVTPTPTPTLISVRDSNCAFSWAHQDLPEIAEAAQEAFSTISVAKIEVIRADAYGENCGQAFSAMTTDFYLSVKVTDLADSNQLAQMVRTAYGVLTALKVKMPAQMGYLDMVFTSGREEKHFRAMFATIKPIMEGEKSAAELLEVGGIE